MFGMNIKKYWDKQSIFFCSSGQSQNWQENMIHKGWLQIFYSLKITLNRLCDAKSLFTRSQMHICILKSSLHFPPFSCSLIGCIFSHLSTINKLFPKAIHNIKGGASFFIFIFCNATPLNPFSELTLKPTARNFHKKACCACFRWLTDIILKQTDETLKRCESSVIFTELWCPAVAFDFDKK